jgi:hypothetical protein
MSFFRRRTFEIPNPDHCKVTGGDHDWRLDPEGWKPVITFGTNAAVKYEYRTKACAACGRTRELKRQIIVAQNWPKAAEEES